MVITLDTHTVAHLLGRLVPAGDAQLADWHLAPIAVVPGQSTGGLYRLSGTAVYQDAPIQWSLVLKVVSVPPDAPPIFTEPDQPLYWKREVLAYQSGVLDTLPGGLRAPRCIDVTEQPDGSYHLWLEDVADTYGPVWMLAQYGIAARTLGRFNGAYLAGQSMSAYPWLVRDGIASQRGAIEHAPWLRDLIADTRAWQHPLLSSTFPGNTAERLLRLWDTRDALFDALARMPRTLCHLDAWQGNLFFPPGGNGHAGLIAIDWAVIGKAAPGVDPGDLLASYFLFRVEPTDPQTLDTTIFTSYVDGLREAGWQGDPQQARLTYAAFTALKYALRLYWLADVLDESKHEMWERHSRHSMSQFLQNAAIFLTYLLDLADEARALI
jgi:Phosphotransferase enzyme family